MKKALLLGLCLSTAAGSCQAVPLYKLLDVGSWDVTVPSAQQVNGFAWKFAMAYIGVIGGLIVGNYLIEPHRELKDAKNYLNGAAGYQNMVPLIKRNQLNPQASATELLALQNAEHRFNALAAMYDLEHMGFALSMIETHLRKLLPRLWRAATIQEFEKCINEAVAMRQVVSKMAEIIKSSELYKTQFEQQRAEERQKLEDGIRQSQANATRKIIIHQDGKQEAVVAK
jgi:uncharacterized membrane protein YgaE (UPF0421/DUF939 family)